LNPKKESWNPRDIIHTICAFANDYDNVNGGYIVIGVAANDGIPILPPKGVEKGQVDSIQQEIFQYCNRIEPRYIPTIEVVNYPDDDTHLIYLKCSAGDAGPYQAPVDVYSKKQADKKIDKAMNSGKENSYTLKHKIPVYIGYFTAWVGDNGEINFYEDVYDRDQRLAQIMMD